MASGALALASFHFAAAIVSGGAAAAATAPAGTSAPYVGCECDFVFIIDSSQSIGYQSFTAVKTFVADLLRFYDVRPDRVRVGVIFFNRHVIANFIIEIGRYSSAEELERRILATPYYTDVTNTAEALRAAKKMLDSVPWRGAKTFILFTDGRHDYGDDPIPIGESMRAEGIEAVCVGVPGINGILKPIDVKELEAIAGSMDRVILVDNATQLDRYKDKMEEELPCKPEDCPTSTSTLLAGTSDINRRYAERLAADVDAVATPIVPTTTPPACTACDIIPIIDSSESITHDVYRALRLFAVSLVRAYNVAADQTRFGYVVFSDSAFDVVHFDRYTDVDDLCEHIMSVRWAPGLTDSAAALEAAYDILKSGGRPDVGKYVLFVSDGRHTTGGEPAPVADRMRADYDAQIACLGVPGINGFLRPVDIKELTAIAGGPGQVITVPSAVDLPYTLKEFVKLMPCATVAMTHQRAAGAG